MEKITLSGKCLKLNSVNGSEAFSFLHFGKEFYNNSSLSRSGLSYPRKGVGALWEQRGKETKGGSTPPRLSCNPWWCHLSAPSVFRPYSFG